MGELTKGLLGQGLQMQAPLRPKHSHRHENNHALGKKCDPRHEENGLVICRR